MLSKLITTGIVVLGLAGASFAGDRGDRYRGGSYYDRGERYSHHNSHHDSGRWSVGFGYSSGGYYGDRSYVSIGYSNRNFSGYYSYQSYPPVCSTPVYVAPRPVYVQLPVYVSPPVVYTPAPVIVERPVYVAPPVVYQPAPTYYYNSCGSTYYSGARYYYGR